MESYDNSNDERDIHTGKIFFAGTCLSEDECRFLAPLIDDWYAVNDVTREFWRTVERYTIYDYEILFALDNVYFTLFAEDQLGGNDEARGILERVHDRLSARLAPQSTLQWSS